MALTAHINLLNPKEFCFFKTRYFATRLGMCVNFYTFSRFKYIKWYLIQATCSYVIFFIPAFLLDSNPLSFSTHVLSFSRHSRIQEQQKTGITCSCCGLTLKTQLSIRIPYYDALKTKLVAFKNPFLKPSKPTEGKMRSKRFWPTWSRMNRWSLFSSWCPYVCPKNKIRATTDTMHKDNDHLLTGVWWVILNLPDLLCFF